MRLHIAHMRILRLTDVPGVIKGMVDQAQATLASP
jgi:hypothetical protein